jgi:hypothetical protein
MKNFTQSLCQERIFEPELSLKSWLDSQERNQSLVVTRLAVARLAPQL